MPLVSSICSDYLVLLSVDNKSDSSFIADNDRQLKLSMAFTEVCW